MRHLYATKKPNPGSEGLKDKVTSLSFTSDKLFNGRQPKSELLELLNYKPMGGSAQPTDIMVRELNDPTSGPDSRLRMILTELPKDSLNHRFTFIMKFESGKVLEAATRLQFRIK